MFTIFGRPFLLFRMTSIERQNQFYSVDIISSKQMSEYVFPRIKEKMLFDGKVKKLQINGLVSKSFPGEKHVRIQRRGGGGGGGGGGGRWSGPAPLEFSDI